FSFCKPHRTFYSAPHRCIRKSRNGSALKLRIVNTSSGKPVQPCRRPGTRICRDTVILILKRSSKRDAVARLFHSRGRDKREWLLQELGHITSVNKPRCIHFADALKGLKPP